MVNFAFLFPTLSHPLRAEYIQEKDTHSVVIGSPTAKLLVTFAYFAKFSKIKKIWREEKFHIAVPNEGPEYVSILFSSRFSFLSPANHAAGSIWIVMTIIASLNSYYCIRGNRQQKSRK